MSSTLKMLKPVLAELSVTVSKEEVNKSIEKAYANLRRSAQVRGFRKGKAPRGVLQRLYGPAVLHEVQSEIINRHLLSSILENELDPLSTPQLDAPALSPDADYSFTATFETRPEIDKIDFSGIELERLKVAVAEADVANELEKIRSALASVSELPEPRPAAEGDVAVVALKRWTDGEWQDSGFSEQEIVLGEGQAPEQIDEGIVGMSVGEEKVIDMGSETEVEEDRLRYLVTLKALKERKLPELDDEMAKDTGKYETLDELKADIEARILAARNQQDDQRLRHSLFEQLRKKNPVELPPSLVERQTDALRRQLLGQFGDQMPKDKVAELMEGVSAGARRTAEEIVHQHLLTMAIAKLESIKVEDSDIDQEVAQRAEAAGIPVPMLKAELNKEGRRHELAATLLERKIFEFAKSSVKIIDVDKLTEPSVDASVEDTETSEETGSSGAPQGSGGTVSAAAAEKPTEKKTDGKKTAKKKAAAEATEAAESGGAAKKKAATGTAAAKKSGEKRAAVKKTPASKTAAKKDKTEA